jgi:serine/threonine-protein kinase
MTPEKYRQVKEIYQGAIEVTPDERESFLVAACKGDENLQREVASLLAFREVSEKFIETPAFAAGARLLVKEQRESLEGQTIGQYSILSEIGQGGMGVVYRAARSDDQFQKEVAIKIVRLGLDTEDMRRRFRHERQILAAIDHPNIAKLLDGGTTGDGRPYLVMDYVDGVPLTTYSDQKRLSTTARLKLFLSVCSAVSYAHQNLVIHRDIKAANVLVTADGVPKLLDFGIAKLLNADAVSDQAHTVTQLGVMTPEYASPEQVRGEQVTTATDVYSLGVLLYELLTGHRPYRIKSRRSDEIMRVICEQQPTRPSAAVSTVEVVSHEEDQTKRTITPEVVSAARDQSPERLRRSLSGDLDNIVLMALRKEPQRRYSSVAQFADDITRHMQGLPVVARTDTVWYRTSKFVTRHKLGVAAAVIVLVGLLTGVAAVAWQARVARRERDKATLEQAKAQRINKFMQETLGAPNPNQEGRDVKVIDVLEKAARRAETELANQPEVLAEVRRTIGYTYYNLELYDKGEPLLRSALKTFKETLGENHEATASCMKELGELLAYQEKYDEAIPLLHKSMETFSRPPAQDASNFVNAKYALAQAFYFKGDLKTAESLYREVLDYALKNLTEDDPLVADASHELGNLVRDRDYEDAIALYRRSIKIVRPFPEKRMNLATGLSNLGLALINAGRFDEAEPVLRESYSMRREIFGENNASAAIVLAHLSRVSYARGAYPQAETEARQAVSVMEKTLPKGHRNLAPAYVSLGRALMKSGKLAEAEKYLRQGLDIHVKRSGPEDRSSAVAESSLGECMALQKRHAEAEPLLKHGYEVLHTKLGSHDWTTVESLKRLISLYEKWNQADAAASYRANL